jgi:hypothetical protein
MQLLRTRRSALIALATAGAIAGTVAPVATHMAGAANIHTVRTANSPSTGKPVAGGGTWIVNRPDAYYLGRAMPGRHFASQSRTAHGWFWGRATPIQLCGYVLPKSLNAAVLGHTANNCSQATKSKLSHRRAIGRDFNARVIKGKNKVTDGTSVSASTACTLYYNYFHGSNFAGGHNGGHWADRAGMIQAQVFYRFTTLDRKAAVVRDPKLGWGFVPLTCVRRPAKLYNDND